MENNIQYEIENHDMIPPIEQPIRVREPVILAAKPITYKPPTYPIDNREPISNGTVIVKKTRRRKRCSNGKRRNPKTHRCNKKCPAGYKRSKTSRRCIRS